MNKIIRFLFTIFIFNLISCSDVTLSPQDEIKLYIENAKIAAESRSHNDFSNLIDEQYQDQKGWDKKQIKNLAHAYFFTHKNIYLFTKIRSIDFQNQNHAFVVLHVAMAGSVIDDLSALTSIRARVYKFQLQLIKENVWLLQQAKWQSANINDML